MTRWPPAWQPMLSVFVFLTSLFCEPLWAAERIAFGEHRKGRAAQSVVLGESARPAKAEQSTHQLSLMPLAQGSPALLRLAPMPQAAQSKLFLSSPERDLPPRVGEPRDTLQAAIARLKVDWMAPQNGRRVARLAVNSPGAGALRVALRTDSSMPMEIRVQGSAAPTVLSLRRQSDPKRPQESIWTPVTDGEQQEIEISIEDHPGLELPQITVPLVSHFPLPVATDAAARAPQGKDSGLAESCSENVICLPSPTPAYQNAVRAAVKLVFTRQGTSYQCTGTLINDGDAQTQVPYVITAAHCIDAQATAGTVNAFFFFEAPTCGSNTVPSYRQLSAGARLLHVNTVSDVALLRLNEPAPEGSWFSGWDATVVPDGTATLMIHHPGGGPKAYSIGLTLPPRSRTTSRTCIIWLPGCPAHPPAAAVGRRC